MQCPVVFCQHLQMNFKEKQCQIDVNLQYVFFQQTHKFSPETGFIYFPTNICNFFEKYYVDAKKIYM